MSYVDEFKERIQEEKDAKIERYKQFMEDFVVVQFVNSLTNNANINLKTLIDNDINKQDFANWLGSEGFNVINGANSITISID